MTGGQWRHEIIKEKETNFENDENVHGSKNPKLIWLSISIHDESSEIQNLIGRISSDSSELQ